MRSYGGASRDVLYGIVPSIDGSHYAAGETQSFGSGGKDIWALKLDRQGELLWQRAIGGAGEDYFNDFWIEEDNTLRISGLSERPNPKRFVRIEILLDEAGKIVWQKEFEVPDGGPARFSMWDGGGEGQDPGPPITGKLSTYASMWFCSLNEEGGLEWQSSVRSDWFSGASPKIAHPARGGGIIAAGSLYNIGATGSWLGRFDAGGELLWNHLVGFNTGYWVGTGAIWEREDGGWLVTGNSDAGGRTGHPWLLSLDALGEIEWHQSYEHGSFSLSLSGLALIGDGSFVLVGNIFGPSFVYPLAMKVGPGGNIQWSKGYGAEALSYATGLCPSEGGFLISGYAKASGHQDLDGRVWKIDTEGEMDPGCQSVYRESVRPVGSTCSYYGSGSGSAGDFVSKDGECTQEDSGPPGEVICPLQNVVLPGDCDGDGSVSIAELQKAINMFLGSIPPECGVDCDGDGKVSISELQKVISAFLGLQSSC